ncbi:MAG: putative acetyltransferase [Marmoricola sp.]
MESAPDPGLEHVAGAGRLNPDLIGRRVVVRSRIPGETGPTGGPAFTDVLGILETWQDGVLTVRRGDGEVVAIDTSLIVSGKAIPDPPRRRRGNG